ncbi:glycosyltransferase family 4 protein [Hyphococcus sp. DH-69]|uniref:glycosyltransferase family 4 protein n=1 Tax=Hyphococcus formosus TaxID=3143534 RepID=UPI00398BB5A0
MKYLYSHRTRSADGQYVHIASLTHALQSRGAEIVMAGPDDGKRRQLDADNSGGGLKALLPAPVYECAEYGYSYIGYRRLAKLFAEHAPDILYERYNLFYHAGAWLKRRKNLPMILEVNAPLADERAAHGDLSLRAFARKSEAAIWRAANAVLPVTDVLARRVAAAGVDEAKIHTIQNGVEPAFLDTQNPKIIRAQYGLSDKLVLGFTGFVRAWHGVDKVVRYLAQSPRSDLHLFIVGDGPARNDLEQLAQALGVANQVTFTGVVQRDAMPAHVAAFDIALQPAVVDYASPLKLFEYMAQAKPVVAPLAANIQEVVTNGKDGILFEQDGLEAALTEVINDHDLRQRIGAAARETIVKGDYTWAGNARRVEAIADSLLGVK